MRVGEAAFAELVAMCRMISVLLLPAAVAVPDYGCDVGVPARRRIPRVLRGVAADLGLQAGHVYLARSAATSRLISASEAPEPTAGNAACPEPFATAVALPPLAAGSVLRRRLSSTMPCTIRSAILQGQI